MVSEQAIEEFDALMLKGKVTYAYHPEDHIDQERDSQARKAESNPQSIESSQSRPSKSTIRSSVPEENEEDDGDDEDDNTSRMRSSFSNKRASSYIVPRTRYIGNTGPKGVIADAQAYERAKIDKVARHVRMSVVQPEVTHSISLAAQPKRKARDVGPEDDDESGVSDLDFELSEGEENEFMTNWREKRMSEYYSGMMVARVERKALKQVDSAEFLRTVEGRGTVIVFIYDQSSSLSPLFEAPLRRLADQYDNIPFICITGEEAEIDEIALPGILAYKNGEQIACLVPLIDYMPDEGDLSEEMMEGMLKRHRVLP